MAGFWSFYLRDRLAGGRLAGYFRLFSLSMGLHNHTCTLNCRAQSVKADAMPLATWSRLLRERPYTINTLQGAALGAVGDLVAQRLERGSGMTIDWRQFASATAISGLQSGIFVPFFYGKLDVLFPGISASAVVCKTASDIVVQGIGTNATALAGRGASAEEVVKAMPEVLRDDCVVWLPYNLLAFRLIPTHIRATTTAIMTLGWNTYLSSVACRARDTAAASATSSAGADGASGSVR